MLLALCRSSFEGAGHPGPAVRIFKGEVDSVTILSPQLTGATDVVDASNVPAGAWVSRSGGGFTIVGTTPENATCAGNAALTAAGGATHGGDLVGVPGSTAGHALLVGESGEIGARLAIETSGALRWGSGHSFNFDTTMERMISTVVAFAGPVQLRPGHMHSTTVTVSGANTTDIASATLSTLGEALVSMSARVAAPDRVLVMWMAPPGGATDVSLPSGDLRVVVTKFG